MPIPTEIPQHVLKKARDLATPGVTKPFYILKLSLAATRCKKHHFADLVSTDDSSQLMFSKNPLVRRDLMREWGKVINVERAGRPPATGFGGG